MKNSVRFSRSAMAAMLSTLVLGLACGKKIEMELTPTFTRAVHLVDVKDAQIISADNYQKITDGMTQDQVRAVFGTTTPTVRSPNPDDEFELVWEMGEKEITVRFRGEKSIGKSQTGVIPDTN